MRVERYSITARDQLQALLLQGFSRFGIKVALEKRELLQQTIDVHLARHPRVKRPRRRLRLVVYPVTDTPFVVLYDYDDIELRVHFVLHRRASLRHLDPTSAEW